MKKGLHIIRSLFSEIKYPNILNNINGHCFTFRSEKEIKSYKTFCYLHLKCINCGCLYGTLSEKEIIKRFLRNSPFIHNIYIPQKNAITFNILEKYQNMTCAEIIMEDIVE